MSFFRKLFGGDDDGEKPAGEKPAEGGEQTEGATTTVEHAALSDPYRGAVLVDETEAHVEITKDVKPIWHYRSRVLCIELGHRLPVRSMVYTGKGRNKDYVRRVTFGDGGVRVDWEYDSFDGAVDGWIARVEDRVIIPRHAGIIAVHLVTGEMCWELPHTAKLAKKPTRDVAGGLLLVFEDQRWLVVDPRDGAARREGTAKSDRDIENVSKGFDDLVSSLRSYIEYGGCRIRGSDGGLEVSGGNIDTDDDPKAPKVGAYPLEDGWEPVQWMALAGGKLCVRLRRQFQNRSMAAVALFDPTSLEPLQLLELCRDKGSGDGWVVDDVVLVDLDMQEPGSGRDDDVMFVVDPHSERVIAMFDEEGKPSHQFDRDGDRVWSLPL